MLHAVLVKIVEMARSQYKQAEIKLTSLPLELTVLVEDFVKSPCPQSLCWTVTQAPKLELCGLLGDMGHMGEMARTGERCLSEKGETGRVDGEREDWQGDGERLSRGERQRKGDTSRLGEHGRPGDKWIPGERLQMEEGDIALVVVSTYEDVFGLCCLDSFFFTKAAGLAADWLPLQTDILTDEAEDCDVSSSASSLSSSSSSVSSASENWCSSALTSGAVKLSSAPPTGINAAEFPYVLSLIGFVHFAMILWKILVLQAPPSSVSGSLSTGPGVVPSGQRFPWAFDFICLVRFPIEYTGKIQRVSIAGKNI